MNAPWKCLRGKGAIEILLLLKDKRRTFTEIQGTLVAKYDMPLALDTLTNRLKDLVEASLITKEKKEYFLTEKGSCFVTCLKNLQ
jgi:predicted transcriptional regulator